jgi:ligand-binding sensor domain-containing protein
VFTWNPALDVSQYAHKSWTASDGYFKGLITAITPTPDGYLWLGTDLGLVRFDGVGFVPWTPSAGEQLPAEAIQRLLVRRDGSLWTTTFARWKGVRLTGYSECAGAKSTTFWRITTAPYGQPRPVCRPGGSARFKKVASGATETMDASAAT